MARFLSPDSKFYSALSLAADLVIINVLFVVSCFPVFTVGLSARTAHQVIGQMVREEGSRPARTFIRNLMSRPVPAFAWGIIALTLVALGLYELVVFNRAGLSTGLRIALTASLLSGLLLFTGITQWFFHLEGRAAEVHAAAPQAPEVTFSQRFTQSVQSCFGRIGQTAMAVLPWVALVGLPLVAPSGLGMVVFFYLVIGPALAIYLSELALHWHEIN